MNHLKEKIYFIIDFDSTFVTLESLEELAAITLRKRADKKVILDKIKQITILGMEGKITFGESLRRRLLLFQTSKTDIDKLISNIKNNITPSIQNNKKFFIDNREQIYIVSGGFKEFIAPIVKEFGLNENHVLANTFIFNKKGIVTGFNSQNPLSKNGGKIEVIKKLKLNGKIYMVGDGFTDYEVKQNGYAEKFFAFTENIKRDSVIKKADYISASFDEILYKLRLPRALSYPKTMMKVLLLENIHPKAEELFHKEGYIVKKINQAFSENELISEITDVSILGIRSKTQINANIIKTANKLLTIGVFAIGTNQVDLSECSKNGIAVFNAPFSNTRSVVELTLGNIIMLNRHAFDKSQKMHKGIWDKSAIDCHEIRGKRLGIVGYGNIGSQLSVLAENLGMEVFFYDISDKLALGNAKRCKNLKELLKTCDLITIHVDGRIENTNLISENEFKIMKNGVYFLNLSRGFIVDNEALVKYIKNGKIKGAAIDVFPNEPKSNDEIFINSLQNLPNVILTPHIGAGTQEGQKNIAEFVPEKLFDFINTGSTNLSVNLPNLQLPQLQKAHRVIHIHHNNPGVLANLNNIFAKNKINIEGQYLKTNEEVGYVITDVNINYDQNIVNELRSVNGTIKVRILY